jgi:UDP-2,4-diacetamido-2,4,6-trideoxy-beta-L-altropyranose hydrolase
MKSKLESVLLRPALSTDSKLVLSWRNEPGTIPWMKTKRALNWDEHHPWFEKVIVDPNVLFLVIEAEEQPVGQLRFDKENGMAKVSINITESWHGRGVASLAFRAGSEYVKREGFAPRIFARVLVANVGSIRAMEAAGYIITGDFTNEDGPHYIMTHNLDELK